MAFGRGATFGFAQAFGEPQWNRAIVFEEQMDTSQRMKPLKPELVNRPPPWPSFDGNGPGADRIRLDRAI